MAWVRAAKSPKPIGAGPYAGAEILILSEEVTNDIDKTLSFATDIQGAAIGGIPNAKAAQLLWMEMEFAAEATTAGNRDIRIRVLDSSGDIVSAFGGQDLISAGQSQNYMYGRALELVASGITPLAERMPESFMFQKGQTMNISEQAGIDPSDNMILHLGFAVYS